MGEATAKYFAREGAAVIIGGTNPKKGERVVNAIRDESGTARYYAPLNVANMKDCLCIAEKTLEEFGKIDILVNYAGKSYDGVPGMTLDEKFKITIDVNLKGAYNIVISPV